MTPMEFTRHDWMFSKWGRFVVHIPAPRPPSDGTRTQKYPALCGVDLRSGAKSDAPLTDNPRRCHAYDLRGCRRCVAVLERGT